MLGEHPRGPALTADDAGLVIGKGAERVRQLSKEGWIPREGPANARRYRLLDVVHGYLKFRDDSERRSSKSAAHARITDARSREVELRNAQREGILIELEEVLAAIDAVVGLFRQQIGGLPARVTRDLVLRRTIEIAINDILERTSDLAAQRASHLGARRASHQAVAAERARRVGEGQQDASAIVRRARPS